MTISTVIKTLVVGVFVCSSAQAATGMAEIRGTVEGSSLAGTVSFMDTKEGLRVDARITGLPPGKHGFHVHEFGGCADLGKAAGGHYNPRGSPHGHSAHDGPKKAHGGDMGNLEADESGNASVKMVLPRVSVNGRHPVAGRAVIVHEKADDFTQPLGNAGGRIGCGPILVTSN